MGAQLQGTLLERYDYEETIVGDMSGLVVFIFQEQKCCHVSTANMSRALSVRRQDGVEDGKMQFDAGVAIWRGGTRDDFWNLAPSSYCKGKIRRGGKGCST